MSPALRVRGLDSRNPRQSIAPRRCLTPQIQERIDAEDRLAETGLRCRGVGRLLANVILGMDGPNQRREVRPLHRFHVPLEHPLVPLGNRGVQPGDGVGIIALHVESMEHQHTATSALIRSRHGELRQQGSHRLHGLHGIASRVRSARECGRIGANSLQARGKIRIEDQVEQSGSPLRRCAAFRIAAVALRRRANRRDAAPMLVAQKLGIDERSRANESLALLDGLLLASTGWTASPAAAKPPNAKAPPTVISRRRLTPPSVGAAAFGNGPSRPFNKSTESSCLFSMESRHLSVWSLRPVPCCLPGAISSASASKPRRPIVFPPRPSNPDP